ncbi:ABC transporter substrate-binding protein [Actinomadura sp. WMMB 499]|uniref:ABC transporter substrate-binding protein n=1 Tax=Actinomadura sp. WMMB 499 TaxID=1219491 RepID=UPI0020C7DA4B|nr:ABC transporter substrate-binding protein [Actinomadura sp. WMMB 499]
MRSRIGAVFISAGLLAATGCGAPEAEQAAGEGAISRTNCGIEVAVDGPPERIYALYQPGIEMAHALGVSDRLVGTAFLDAVVLPEYADAHAKVEYVPTLPSREAMLETNPDFVLSGYQNVFAEDGSNSVGTRASLRELGVQSWIFSPLCPTGDGRSDLAVDPASVDVEMVYEDLRGLGALLGVEENAEKVIAGLKKRIAAVEQKVAGVEERPTVAIVSPREGGGYRVASGIDFGTWIIERAGGTNVFDDLSKERNMDVGVEELVKRNPDVILSDLCCDTKYTRDDARSEVEAIMDDPALAGVTAVTEKQVHPFLFADRAAGVRAAHSIELVASILHPELFGE